MNQHHPSPPSPPLKPNTQPAFQNPTGYNLSAERKAALVQLAAQYDFLVLADEVYQLLSFTDAPAPPAPLCYFDTPEVVAAGGRGGAAGHVLSIGSFAKILAPGLRLGWLQAAPAGKALLDRLFGCGQLDSSGALNPFVSGIVHTMIDSGAQGAHVEAVRGELTARARALGAALGAALPPAAAFRPPTGGYFIWIRLPPGMDGAALRALCEKGHRVLFQPGARFGTGLENFIRLSFSYYPAGDLAEGAARLGRGMAEMAALLAAGPAPAPPPAGPVLAVHGATGRLGRLILAAAAGGGFPGGAAACARGGAPPASARVVVDVSLPEGTEALLRALLDAPPPHPALVVGTTGALPAALLEAYGKKAVVALVANFSAGAPLLLKVAALLGGAPAGWHGEVVEVHHARKADAPSGTTKRVLAALAEAGVAPVGGAPGAPLPVHALRLGDEVGTHTVHLAGPGERLEVSHVVTRREVFAEGALRVAAWALEQKPGVYVK